MARVEQTTMANEATDARLGVKSREGFSFGPALAGGLGVLTVVAGGVAAVAVALPGLLPVWLVAGSIFVGSTSGALAFWARGAAVPQDLLDAALSSVRNLAASKEGK